MAVFTPVSRDELSHWLQSFELGELLKQFIQSSILIRKLCSCPLHYLPDSCHIPRIMEGCICLF